MAFLINLAGCAPQENPANSAIQREKPVALPIQNYQRFVPMAQHANGTPMLDFALDTKTGQLCRTWPWRITFSARYSSVTNCGRTSKAISNLSGSTATSARP